MLSIRQVPDSEFDAFALSHPKGNFHQTAMMATLRQSMGWDVSLFLIFNGNLAVGAFLLAGKAGRYQVTMGPLFDFSGRETTQKVLDLISAYAKKKKAAVLDIYPYELLRTHDSSGKVLNEYADGKRIIDLFTSLGWRHKGYTVDYDMAANRWSFVKDLTGIQNEADLLASYRQTTRQIIRKFNTRDYSVKQMGYEELTIVKKLIDSSNKKNSVMARPLEYYQKLCTAFGKNVEFLVVYHKDKTPLSAGIFIHHPNEMVYFMSGADTEYRHLYGGHFLQHHMMLRCIKEGITRYNFYWVTGHFDNNPLLVYKAGFRGSVEEYVGGFYKVLSPTRASLLLAKSALGTLRRKLFAR